jgi:hypothetical protein
MTTAPDDTSPILTSPPPSDGYICTRKSVLAQALLADLDVSHPSFARLGEVFKMLSAVLHYEAASQIETLKDLYHPLDPDSQSRENDALAAYTRFEASLVTTLTRANFSEIDADSVDTQNAARLLTGLHIKTSRAGIRRIRFFGRGGRPGVFNKRGWLGLRRKLIEAEILRDVVVLVAFKAETEIAKADRSAFARMRGGMRPGAALIKQFRNVARAELLSLHPGAAPAMRRQDQVFLAVPALAGGVPILLQIGPALTVLFAVLATWFGMGGVIEDNDLKRALAAVSGLVAVGAFVMRQWVKYERQTLKYQKQLADTVYFRTMANNSAVLDALIGEAEEQDAKEAMLAYRVLLCADKALPKTEIDQTAESFLRSRLALTIDFEIGDALGKLARLGLVLEEGELYRAVAPEEALRRLDAAWDSYFKYASV